MPARRRNQPTIVNTTPRAAMPKRADRTTHVAASGVSRLRSSSLLSFALYERYSWYRPYPITPAPAARTRVRPIGIAINRAVQSWVLWPLLPPPPDPVATRTAVTPSAP